MGTYGPNLLKFVEDGRIYGSWWQNGAGTGRMASSSPNLQNLPAEVRRYVKAPAGRVLVVADYSQIELRIAAKISREERMLAAFANGEDIHTSTARSLTGREEITKQERKLAKAVNFGLLYGMSPGGLRNYARASYGVEMTKEEAERYWQHFFETYPGLRAWHDREYRQLKKHGSTETRTLTGRRRTGVTKLTERLNSPVQGTGADGLKLALALLYERRGECPGAVPILAVHDEVVVECPEEQAEEVKAWLVKAMVDGMEEVLNSGLDTDNLERVPVKVEVEVVDQLGRGIARAPSTSEGAASETLPRPLPYASHAASSIPSLVDAQGLRQASISSTTDSSFVPNHKCPGMVGRSASGSQGGSPSTVEGARSSPSWRLPRGALQRHVGKEALG